MRLGRRPLAGLAAAALTAAASPARAADPIRFGFSAQETGGLAGNGRAMLLAMEIWAEDVNAKGGLLGRPVELVHYDDQSNPGLIPGIYTKLLTVDRVDILLAMSTNLVAPAVPLAMRNKKVMMALFATGVNDQFHYDRYFQIQPFGPNGRDSMTRGYFEVAMKLDPKPQTIALVGADAEFAQTVLGGARDTAKSFGLKIVYDQVYPPTTVDLSPVVRAVQAARPELILAASYPPDTVALVRSVREIGLQARMFGGALVGSQYAAIKKQLGAQLNGIIAYEQYTREPTMQFPGIEAFLTRYQARAARAGADALGYYGPPFAYAAMQVLGDAVSSTGSLDQDKIAAHIHADSFATVVGTIKFGADGEWAKPRIITIQYRNLVGNDLAQFEHPGTEIVLYPPEYKSGDVQTPFGA